MKFRKWVKWLKKDIAQGVDIPYKVLFGKEKYLKKYDKKNLKLTKH